MNRTILITAYAVNPYKGSEDGTGWNIIRNLANQNNIIAITRKNNQADIDRYLKEYPLTGNRTLDFNYYDLPKWLTFWKKGSRGALLYHYLWHLGVVFFILKNKFNFSIAHHLNFHSDWTPTFLWLLGKPLVWGPLGHHHKIPTDYIKQHGQKAWLKDQVMWMAKKCFWTFDPFLKLAKWNAVKVLGVNSSVFDVLPVAKNKKCIIPAVATEIPDMMPAKNDQFQILSIGRFVPLKGFDLTIKSFADCYHKQPKALQQKMKLTLVGKGPEKENLIQLSKDCKLPKSAIRFIDWINRKELSNFFAHSKVFLFPSHEGAGMVIPEALSFHLPVVCFDNYGPGENVDDSCAIRIPYTTYDQSIKDFSAALEQLLHQPALRDQMAADAFRYYKMRFTWQKKAQQIQAVYEEISSSARSYAMS